MKILRELIDLPIVTDKVTWEARQVLRDMGEKPEPHILLRVKLLGTYFDQRALEPYVKVGKIQSLFVEISEDGLTARAYFDQPVSTEGVIEFGYGEEAVLRLRNPFEPEHVRVLNARLFGRKKIIHLERFFPDRN